MGSQFMKFIIPILLIFIPTFCWATPPIVVVQQPTVIQRHTVQFDAQTYLGLNGYYGAIDKQKQENLQLQQLDNQSIRTLVEILKGVLDKQATPITPTPNVSIPIVPKNPSPTVGNDLDKQVYNIFKTNCASCHSDKTASGGLKLVTDNGLYNLSALDRSNIYFRTNAAHLKELNLNSMPLNKPVLNDNDVKILAIWAISKIQHEKGK